MFEKMGNVKLATVAAPIGLAVGLALGGAPVQAGYLTDSAGEVVTNNYGECWSAIGGMDESVSACGDAAPAPDDPDSDGDGVPDSRDECPGTPSGVAVTNFGCPKDSDGDGVADYKDKCPGTPAGAKVDMDGCEIVEDITINVTADHFDFDSAALKPAMKAELDDIAERVKASPGDEQLHVIGHTDSTGPEAYNQGLSERRAAAAAGYLIDMGVASGSVSTSGSGESEPVADNGTRDGRAMNRRVEIRTR